MEDFFFLAELYKLLVFVYYWNHSPDSGIYKTFCSNRLNWSRIFLLKAEISWNQQILSIILTHGQKEKSFNKHWLEWEKLNVIHYPAEKTDWKFTSENSTYRVLPNKPHRLTIWNLTSFQRVITETYFITPIPDKKFDPVLKGWIQ